MQQLFLHLAFLLTKHECVIIPDFGGFVATSVSAKKETVSSVFCPPGRIVGFNQELRHNDGLLANSLSKEKGISFNEANLLVQQFSANLSELLHTERTVSIPWLGKLCFSPENKISFIPDKQLASDASQYGFCHFYFPLLKEKMTASSFEHPVSVKIEPKQRDILWVPLSRRFVTTTVSVAATIAALFLASTPVNKQTNRELEQQASLLPIHRNQSMETQTGKQSETVSPDSLSLADSFTQFDTKATSPTTSRRYYIVIASLPDKHSADKTLAKIRSTEFKEADIVSSDGRHRIYIRQLENKKEAEVFLQQFRMSNPQHLDAWLLSERMGS